MHNHLGRSPSSPLNRLLRCWVGWEPHEVPDEGLSGVVDGSGCCIGNRTRRPVCQRAPRRSWLGARFEPRLVGSGEGPVPAEREGIPGGKRVSPLGPLCREPACRGANLLLSLLRL